MVIRLLSPAETGKTSKRREEGHGHFRAFHAQSLTPHILVRASIGCHFGGQDGQGRRRSGRLSTEYEATAGEETGCADAQATVAAPTASTPPVWHLSGSRPA